VQLYYFCRYSGPCPAFSAVSLPILKEPEFRPESSVPLVIDLKDRECGISSLVGGKGSALALLTSLEENKVSINSCDFLSVPLSTFVSSVMAYLLTEPSPEFFILP
jgi:hypothetical protein